jgi:predicted RNA-binding protein YlxR (DUF448 family)
LGCGARDEQKKLIRLVVEGKSDLKIDQSAKARGGYLHSMPACWRSFIRRKSLYRAFHVEIGKDAKEKLIRELTERRWE